MSNALGIAAALLAAIPGAAVSGCSGEDAGFAGSSTQSEQSTDYILAHPDAVNPFALIEPMRTLIDRGDMLQASFLFYFWQIRSVPWAKHGAPDGEGAVRASVNAMVGEVINRWVASDPDAMNAVAERAIAYERRLPLFSGRPAGVSAAIWARDVVKLRQDYADGFYRYAPRDAEAKRKFTETRKRNGLYVGPLQNPGKPLPEAWR